MAIDRTLKLHYLLAQATIAIAIGSLPLPQLYAQDGKGVRGSQSILVISLKTAAGPVSHCSNAALESMYFSSPRSVSAYYAENSYGLLSMSGIVTGPHVVKLGKGWTRTSVANDADVAAIAAGIDPSRYSQRVYILPREADPSSVASGWGGSSAGLRLWIRDYWCTSTWVAAHELGHVFGLNHASTPADEYGDYSSSMGGRTDPVSDPSTWNNTPHYNAAGKIAAGWLPAGAVQIVTVKGTYTIASVETIPAAGQIQALRINASVDSTDFYYVSYRQASGFSSVLTPQYVGTTSITRWNGVMGAKTCLIATLADGQAFSDASGLMVAQASHDAGHAKISIAFGMSPLSNVRITCP